MAVATLFNTSDQGPDPRSSRNLRAHEMLAQKLTIVAEQFVEAAYRARSDDYEATRAHVVYAMSLLRGLPSLPPATSSDPPSTEKCVRGGLPGWQTRRVVAHVEANLSRRIHVQELARLLDLSASHFCRAFKCSLGMSPREFVLQRRIETAKALMLTTSDTLSLIALRCGMCDQQHFTRSFRRIVGDTPFAWRRVHRG